jgi:hypothetical protein
MRNAGIAGGLLSAGRNDAVVLLVLDDVESKRRRIASIRTV